MDEQLTCPARTSGQLPHLCHTQTTRRQKGSLPPASCAEHLVYMGVARCPPYVDLFKFLLHIGVLSTSFATEDTRHKIQATVADLSLAGTACALLAAWETPPPVGLRPPPVGVLFVKRQA